MVSSARKPGCATAIKEEVKQLVGVLRNPHAGVFEIAREDIDRDPEKMHDYPIETCII